MNSSFTSPEGTCLEIERERVPRLDGPFTVEAWVKPIGTNDNGSLVSNLRVGGFGLDIARTPVFTVQTDARGVDARRRGDLEPAIVAKAADKLPVDQWSHLAGVYDGRRITLYVNGRAAASTNAQGARLDSDKSLSSARGPTAVSTYTMSLTPARSGAVPSTKSASAVARVTQNRSSPRPISRPIRPRFSSSRMTITSARSSRSPQLRARIRGHRLRACRR